MSENTQNNATKPMFKATLLTGPSSTQYKNNEAKSQYVIFNAEIIQDGPMKGAIITGAFTLKNAKGDFKQCPNKGDEVTVYADVVNGKPLFEIGSERVETTADADILAMLALAGAQQSGQAV